MGLNDSNSNINAQVLTLPTNHFTLFSPSSHSPTLSLLCISMHRCQHYPLFSLTLLALSSLCISMDRCQRYLPSSLPLLTTSHSPYYVSHCAGANTTYPLLSHTFSLTLSLLCISLLDRFDSHPYHFFVNSRDFFPFYFCSYFS